MSRRTPEEIASLRRAHREKLQRVAYQHSGVYVPDDAQELVFSPKAKRRIDWRYTMLYDHLECIRCADYMDLVAVSHTDGLMKKDWRCPHCNDLATGIFRIPLIKEHP